MYPFVIQSFMTETDRLTHTISGCGNDNGIVGKMYSTVRFPFLFYSKLRHKVFPTVHVQSPALC